MGNRKAGYDKQIQEVQGMVTKPAGAGTNQPAPYKVGDSYQGKTIKRTGRDSATGATVLLLNDNSQVTVK